MAPVQSNARIGCAYAIRLGRAHTVPPTHFSPVTLPLRSLTSGFGAPVAPCVARCDSPSAWSPKMAQAGPVAWVAVCCWGRAERLVPSAALAKGRV